MQLYAQFEDRSGRDGFLLLTMPKPELILSILIREAYNRELDKNDYRVRKDCSYIPYSVCSVEIRCPNYVSKV